MEYIANLSALILDFRLDLPFGHCIGLEQLIVVAGKAMFTAMVVSRLFELQLGQAVAEHLAEDSVFNVVEQIIIRCRCAVKMCPLLKYLEPLVCFRLLRHSAVW